MKAQYAKAPDWLKALMNAWADGLNFYLSTHPNVKPRVITKFEPWMALTFSEGSIGGDIERVNLRTLERFYSGPPATGNDASDGNDGNDLTTSGKLSNRPVQMGSLSPRRIPPRRKPCCGSTRTPRSSSAPSCRCRATRA
jgi:acyl-homoserine lactone acylase PvdQ